MTILTFDNHDNGFFQRLVHNVKIHDRGILYSVPVGGCRDARSDALQSWRPILHTGRDAVNAGRPILHDGRVARDHGDTFLHVGRVRRDSGEMSILALKNGEMQALS